MYGLSEYCGYENLWDQMIRDRIVVGIHDEKLQQLTLETAIAQVHQAETVKKQRSLLRGEDLASTPTVLIPDIEINLHAAHTVEDSHNMISRIVQCGGT